MLCYGSLARSSSFGACGGWIQCLEEISVRDSGKQIRLYSCALLPYPHKERLYHLLNLVNQAHIDWTRTSNVQSVLGSFVPSRKACATHDTPVRWRCSKRYHSCPTLRLINFSACAGRFMIFRRITWYPIRCPIIVTFQGYHHVRTFRTRHIWCTPRP